MMKVIILKIKVKLFPPQGAKKWATDNRRRNYKGRVLGGIESKKQNVTNHHWRKTMHLCIRTRNS